MKKKLLSTVLLERMQTVEFRKIRRDLIRYADNQKREYRSISLKPETITMLTNEGLTVEKVKEHGYESYKITF